MTFVWIQLHVSSHHFLPKFPLLFGCQITAIIVNNVLYTVNSDISIWGLNRCWETVDFSTLESSASQDSVQSAEKGGAERYKQHLDVRFCNSFNFCMSTSEYSLCNFETRTRRSLLETGIIKSSSFSPKRKRCQPLAWTWRKCALLRSSHLWVSPQFEGSSLLCSMSSIFHPLHHARFTSRTNRGKQNTLYFRLPGLTSETFSWMTAPLICISS